MQLLLGSKSPRRSELLSALGFSFKSVRIDCDEMYPETMPVEQIAEYLAELKSNAYQSLVEDQILLTCDTVVALEQQVLGKPKNAMQAYEMLSRLSGQTHTVYTGVCLKSVVDSFSFTECARVEFEIITREEIEFYVSNFKPFDKAGSYGIQEWLGMAKIKNLEGSYYTIMGLPTHRVYQELVKRQVSPIV